MVSWDEVAKHGPQSSSKWVVVDGEVFDVSAFASLHPGGVQLLVAQAGQDASEVFHLYHHEGVLRKYREKLKVGDIDGFVKEDKVVPYADPIWYRQFNSPYFKDTHVAFRDRVRHFVDTEFLPRVDEWAMDKKPPREFMERLGKEGFLACLTGAKEFPREYLDPGTPEPEAFDFFHEMILLDELSRCANGSLMAAITNGPAIALSAIMAFGSEELRDKVAREVLMGRQFIALAVSEPNAGSDVAGLMTRASRRGDSYVVNGVKKWITNSSYADWLVTAVITNPQVAPHVGTSMVLIDAHAPGLSIRKVGLEDRAAIAGTSFLEFDNVEVPLSHLIGEENKGFLYTMHNFNHERVYVSTICNRLSRVCVEECFKFAQKRKTFGKQLIQHDVIRVKLAQMACRVEQQQAWLESVVYQMCTMSKSEANARLGDVICGIKAQAAEVLEYVASQTTHIFGGNALDSRSVGRRIEPMTDAVKAYVVPAGSTKIMELQMTKLALKFAQTQKAKL